MSHPLRIGVLASHSGTTLQSIVDACESSRLGAEVCVVISNNSKSLSATRAKRHGISFFHLSGKTHPTADELDAAICTTLAEHNVELVMLAGYMKKLGPTTLSRFRGRILNTHPALLPRHGGQGMYGDRVHAAVIDAGETETGVTIHGVDDDYDTGPAVAQCKVPVMQDDDVESLADRVKKREKEFLLETLQAIVEKQIPFPIDSARVS